MFDAVKASILRFGNFSEDALDEIIGRLKIHTIERDGMLVSKAKIYREFYFVNSGAFRQYNILDNDLEQVSNLYLENDWFFDHKSLVTQTPSESFVQATEDSEVFELSIHDFHELIKKSDAFFQIGRIFESGIQNHEYQNVRLTPDERYSLLLTKRPEVIHKFPLKYIASYLGIAPETLSRVRRKICS